ncbi:MAG: hypothetical protein LUF35_14215 [Lachnospiraceae bacterium]|nr:hypothetical protein [Lachnospiraceae bacterium]
MAVLFFSILIWTGTIYTAQAELFADILSSGLRLILPIILAVLICLIVILFFQWMNGFSDRSLFICSGILFAGMSVGMVVILANFRSVPITDALHVQNCAMYFAVSGEHTLSADSVFAGYFGKYANNYFITILFTWFFQVLIFFKIDSICLALEILAAVGILAATLFVWLIGKRICGLKFAVKVLFLCVLNPLYYLMILWVYTNTLSIPFMMAVFYFGVCAYQSADIRRRMFDCVLMTLFAVAGYFIRATVIIPVIAFAICAVLWSSRDKKRWRIVLPCVILCIFAGSVFYKAVTSLNESYFSTVSDNTFPVTHWLMIGSQGERMHDSNATDYTLSFESKEEKTKATLQKTIENYKAFTPTSFVNFLYNKLMISWSYADAELLGGRLAQDTLQTKLYIWVLGDKSDFLSLYAYAFRIATMFLMIFSLYQRLKTRSWNLPWFVSVLTFFGAILFYSIWEVKTSYQCPFLYYLLLIAADGGELLTKKVERIRQNYCRKLRPLQIYAILASILCIFVVSYHAMTTSVVTLHDWSVWCGDSSDTAMLTLKKDGQTITQEFYTSKTFSWIRLLGGTDEEAAEAGSCFRISLLDESGEMIYTGDYSVSEFDSVGQIVINIDEIVPDGRQKYTLQIEKTTDDSGKIYFRRLKNYYIDSYEGNLTVNGDIRTYDLHIQVGYLYSSIYLSRKFGLLLFGGLFLGLLACCAWLSHGLGRIGKCRKKDS